MRRAGHVAQRAREHLRREGVVLRRRLEDFEVLVEVLVQLEDGGDVAAAVAVVGRGPHGHQRVVEHVLVALHDELVRARDELDGVRRVELRTVAAAAHRRALISGMDVHRRELISGMDAQRREFIRGMGDGVPAARLGCAHALHPHRRASRRGRRFPPPRTLYQGKARS